MNKNNAAYLEELLNIYWIRPENAFWLSKVMQKLDAFEWYGPKLDLMCGHGMWSFIKAGGAFGIDFDVHQEITQLEDYQKGVDIQNNFSEKYKPSITRKPNYRMEYGLDWKQNNLEKCGSLDFYDNLILANCNEKLPLEDNLLGTIFCNTIYWVDDINHILREVSRILKPDGKAYLVNYLPAINNYLDFYRDKVSSEWIELIDRKRSNENKHIFTKEEWLHLYDIAGLELVEYVPTVNQLYAHIWNIGMRPLAGYIIEMSHSINKDKLEKIKSGWIRTLKTILTPFVENPEFYNFLPGQEVEAIFVLRKKI